MKKGINSAVAITKNQLFATSTVIGSVLRNHSKYPSLHNNPNFMNKFFEKSIWIFALCLFFASQVAMAQSTTCISGSVQNTSNSPWSEECYLNNSCGLQGNPCTANDVRLLGTYFADQNGNSLPIFNIGDTVQVYLWGTFRNGTNTNRYAIRTRTEMYLDGVFVGEINDCSFDNLLPGIQSDLLVGPITYVFGQQLELANTWVGWETSAAQCSNPNGADWNWRCGQYASSKCGRTFAFIKTIVPNFAYTCGTFTANSIQVCFQDLTSGGTPPYTYSWNFGDGSPISTQQNPCHTYNSITGSYNATLSVTDAEGVVSAATLVVNLDNLFCPDPKISVTKPTLTCPSNITVNNDAGLCTAVVTYSVPFNDNCPGSSIAQTAGLASGSAFPKGTTTNTFVVTDAAGNTATCSFTVTVNDNENPTLTCPSNITVNNDAGLCTAVVTYSVPFNDNCPGSSIAQTAGLASGSAFPKGTTINTFVVTDAAGNTATCSFTVTVNDNENPTLTCPSNITVNNDAGLCTAIVTYSVPFNDNCPGSSIAQTAGLASGSAFPKGTTTNTFVVTDAAGNTATCSFTVTVIDNEGS
jgi:hypothetical protein